jgi:glycogen debranching enzyme
VTEIAPAAESYAIVADADRIEAPLRVLKHGESFAVFDQHGDIVPAEAGEQGLYYNDTRFLSRCELTLGGRRPLLLSSSVTDDNTVFTVDLMNPDLNRGERDVIVRGQVHVFRSIVLCDGCCYQRIRVSNYGLERVELPLTMKFEGDFADLFEVRGTRRAVRGERLPISSASTTAVLGYRGLDRLERRTRLDWSVRPDQLDNDTATFLLALKPKATVAIDLITTCEVSSETLRSARLPSGHDDAVAETLAQAVEWRAVGCRVTSSSESFNRWLMRSEADLLMMITKTPYGSYPYAGVPWFSTPFGRDGIITALELLWAQPAVAQGVLSFLATTQATRLSDAQDAQPGKILHEMRGGEMANLGEVPFARYYGSIDATPLFLMLVAEYYERTADRALVDRLWPNVLAAVEWMDAYGDTDGDGFIEYARRSPNGLAQQGWKDSHDSVFHADGTLAEHPIALCEVQGYAYAAWRGVAKLASARGERELCVGWERRAETLRQRFDEAFWCDDLGTYALALDGRKRQCRVRTSNAAHCLLTGVARPERVRPLSAALMSDTSFAGWGVRTLDANELRYNPMSYHNGSIWPHDNALAAAGFARYGFNAEAARIFGAMFHLSDVVELHRLPELICGFHRRNGQRPTLYPVACAPQAWAAGAVYLLLQSCIGLAIDGAARRVTFTRTVLPDPIDWLRISHLQVADAWVDLLLERHGQNVSLSVLQRSGDVEIHATK